jgi:hypothetical protein
MKTGFYRAAILFLALALGGAAPQAAPPLSFKLVEGQNLNAFVQQGPVAAHLLLSNGVEPRIVVAFPAGNSGVGLWFGKLDRGATWRLESEPRPVRDGAFNGVTALASIDAPRLIPKQAILSSVRFLRDYQAVARFPEEVGTAATVRGNTISYRRQRLDGTPGYALTMRVLDGRVVDGAVVAPPSGRIRIELTALSADQPLTPIPIAELLNARAAPDPAARNALRFLSYREKFLAGSWRFNTYFGRDTLMSLRLLMPALQPAAIEAGLTSVIARLTPGGEVAHEEGIGEFAVVANAKAGRRGDAAELDYNMVDDDFMLAPVAADYLLGSGRARADAYLNSIVRSESEPGRRETAGAALVRNLRHILSQSRGFVDAPVAGNLIAVRPGRMAGQWRDSDEGLGRGIYAYDVNAVLVPAALDAIDRLVRARLLDAYLTSEDRARFTAAAAMAARWRSDAPPLFRVTIPAAQAGKQIAAYADRLAIPAAPAVTSLGTRPLVFHAISLDKQGAPVPIMHSDEGFELMFGTPSPAFLDEYVGAIMRPFPAGLMTDIGLLIANPAFADRAAQDRFTPAAYHGAVVWSWQQALLASGLERQLARPDLPAATRRRLVVAQAALWRAIRTTRATQSSELWSWAYRDGRYQVVPFGAGKADVDESNAAQLWSTVYLAVRDPRTR